MYATQQDIVDRYGQDLLLLIADRDADAVIDVDVVTRALTDATAEIDTYLAAKYELPLPSVPEVLVRLCVDVVVYRLSSEADAATEERRIRYDDAIALLRRIASGEVSLGLPDPPPSSSGAAVVSGEGRVFSRKSMRGVS
jgi:phage gp36-like protein